MTSPLIKEAAPHPRKYTHPLVFLLLIIPFGAASGFLTVTIVYLLGKSGVSPATIALLTGLSYIPQTFKFLYAPLVDLTFTRKQWFIAASICSAAGIALLGAIPATQAGLPWLKVLVVTGNFATAFLSMSVESLMAYNTAPGELGRTAGWFQAGNLGGGGLGGGLALVIAERSTIAWLPGVVLALACLATGAAILYTHEPEPELPEIADAEITQRFPILRSIQQVFLDLWQVARSRTGYLGLLICFLPIGSGAAAAMFPLFANEWGASGDDVALTSGALAGLLSALGCMIGGFFCDRMDRKQAYAAFGFLLVLCSLLMAWSPHNRSMYFLFVLSYNFINGLCYAAFTAVTLEAIGTGAVATKYSIFASLSNTPIAYMIVLNGYWYEKFGSKAGLFNDAAMGVAGITLFFTIRFVSQSLINQYRKNHRSNR